MPSERCCPERTRGSCEILRPDNAALARSNDCCEVSPMLLPEEELDVTERFGVARAQVRRDHLISHLLAALSDRFADRVVFFGGTALSRTFAPDGRLSEDIDLIARGARRELAGEIEKWLVRATRREFPGLRWSPPLSTVRDVEPAVVLADDGVSVRVQLLNAVGIPSWPLVSRPLVQRYSDVAPAELLVPTRTSFAAWKTTAWMNRAASRDLYDLWLLSRIGAIDSEAAVLFAKHGPTGKPPSGQLFRVPPDETAWRRDLSSQTRLEITAAEALDVVRGAWAAHAE